MQQNQRTNPFAALRRFIRKREEGEHCELCKAELSIEHQHLIEPSSRKISCVCVPCAILFSNTDGKYRRIPKRIRFLQNFQMSDSQWDSLMIPISMAFFFRSANADKVIALYPSPAGATESLLTLEAWAEIVEQNPTLKQMEPDVEALLVNRMNSSRNISEPEYYLSPIDECFKLTGLIRMRWRGLSGGAEVWEEIERFFSDLKRHSINVKEDCSA